MDSDVPAQAAVPYLCESVSIFGFHSLLLPGRDRGKDGKPQMNTDGRRCPSSGCSALSVRICVHLWSPFFHPSGQGQRKRRETTDEHRWRQMSQLRLQCLICANLCPSVVSFLCSFRAETEEKTGNHR